LIVLIILATIILVRVFDVPKADRNLIFFTTGPGWLDRFVFAIPFCVFIFGVSGYLFSSFIDELNQIFAFFSFILGICVFLILISKILEEYGKSLKHFFIISFVFTVITGYNNQWMLPIMPSNNIFLNSFFAFNVAFGQGIGLMFFITIFWAIFVALTNIRVRLFPIP